MGSRRWDADGMMKESRRVKEQEGMEGQEEKRFPIFGLLDFVAVRPSTDHATVQNLLTQLAQVGSTFLFMYMPYGSFDFINAVFL